MSWGWRLGGIIPFVSEYKKFTQGAGKIAKIIKRVGRDGDAVEITLKDGRKIDINNARVKEWIPNTHPSAPAGVLDKVKFTDFIEGSKGYKRTPTQEEINFLKQIK